MTRKPDEIKKGLVEAIEETIWVVEGGDAHDLQDACDMAHASMADALALIQQLQADNAQLNRCIENMTDKLNAMNDEVAKLQAERDAAVEALKNSRDCQCCIHYDVKWDEPCIHCDHDNNCFEWRGVQREE